MAEKPPGIQFLLDKKALYLKGVTNPPKDPPGTGNIARIVF